ncbi:MAG: hypothetical protein JWM25_1511, partial [Thermoleophilia bacterium]|nr:hypothetical protein [Thermoleophilia bacterium]
DLVDEASETITSGDFTVTEEIS